MFLIIALLGEDKNPDIKSIGREKERKYKLMKQATKKIIESLVLVGLIGSMYGSTMISTNPNDNAVNEDELVYESKTAFAGAMQATAIMLNVANETISEDSNNVSTVKVPLEECKMTEDGEIVQPEFVPYELYVNVSYLNVRSTPSLENNDNVIGKLNINDKIYVLGETESEEMDWLIIYYEGGIDSLGFISSEFAQETLPELDTYNKEWTGATLNRHCGTVNGPSGKETYYNLNMSKVIYYMQQFGYYEKYWVRSDGVKMYGNYVMVAANLKVHPKGTLVETSLGTGIVVDTGEFARSNSNQIDIAVNW